MDSPDGRGPLFYDKEGKPIYDTLKWAKLFEDTAYQIIKQDYTPDKSYWVSTVWLGIDHDFSYRYGELFKVNPHPVIFETMVFDRRKIKDSFTDLDQYRYTTEGEAKAGHKELLEKYTDIEQLAKTLDPSI